PKAESRAGERSSLAGEIARGSLEAPGRRWAVARSQAGDWVQVSPAAPAREAVHFVAHSHRRTPGARALNPPQTRPEPRGEAREPGPLGREYHRLLYRSAPGRCPGPTLDIDSPLTDASRQALLDIVSTINLALATR